MASFAPIRGTRAQLTPTTVPPVTPIVDGQFLIETDQGNESKIYTDIDDGGTLKRIVVGGGGHDMIPIVDTSVTPNVTDMEVMETLTDGNDHYVANAYTIQRWSNCSVVSLFTTATQGTDTIGLWELNWKNYDPTTDDPTVYRAGWLWSEDLFGVLSDPALKDNMEITPIFDIANSEVISLYAYRIDDAVYLTVTPVGSENPSEEGWYVLSGGSFILTTDTTVQGGTTYYKAGGAVALKLNHAVYSTSGVKVGLNLKYQRIDVKNFDVIS